MPEATDHTFSEADWNRVFTFRFPGWTIEHVRLLLQTGYDIHDTYQVYLAVGSEDLTAEQLMRHEIMASPQNFYNL